MKQSSLAFLSILLSTFCCAGPVYKVIGADGSVSYTDQAPPSKTASKVLPGVGNKPKASEPASKGDLNRDPVLASLQLYYKQIIVESASHLCTNLAAERPDLPGTKEASKDVSAARSNWYNRHAILLEKKNKILHDKLSNSELNKAADDAKNENEPIREKLEKEPASERLKWCKNMPSTLKSPEFDLMSNSVLFNTIISYKIKE